MRVMPFLSSKVGACGLAIAGALAMIVAGSAIGPAHAGDDGSEPIWTGLGDLVGVTGKDKEAPIDYRERGRLVLPPKMALPAPGAPPASRTAAWPVDPDVERVRKEKDALHQILSSQSDLQAQRDGDRLSPYQLRVDHSAAGHRQSGSRCAAQSNRRGCDFTPFHNVMETIGLAKPDEVVAGEEPDRDWLTDPPKGYRMPTTNTVATSEIKRKVNDADPRTALYHPPEQ
jgi:hypothetical protein